MIGAKVRQKSGEGPLMTVKRVTAAGYLVCEWYELSRGHQERMFFPEAVVIHQEEDTAVKGPGRR